MVGNCALASNIKESSVCFNELRPNVILPKAGQRNVLITAALPYVNNVPHLGNIIGSVLSADVYARYCRSIGYNALFICGTDEYGTATETKALQDGVSCEELCSKYYEVHKDVYKWFGIDMDYFGRTATPLQTEITQSIYSALKCNGFIYEDTVEQLFCDSCSRFLADRFIEGTCGFCGYLDARGDQCDKCGRLLNAVTELKDPRCKLDSNTPKVRQSSHHFLNLPSLQEQCHNWLKATSDKAMAKWSSNAVDISEAWFSKGLTPRCITRDLKWGTAVPDFPNKVFYVWFDACIGYISITANYLAASNCTEWKKWWMNPNDVELVQFMGKDNVPFHTVVFPSSLLGTGEPYTMLKSISTTEYLNYEDGKFSKSRNIGVFGDQAAKTNISQSVWRYYLLINRPESSDSVFSWDDLQAKNNGDLLGNIGNLVSRIVKFVTKIYKSSAPSSQLSELKTFSIFEKFIGDVNEHVASYICQMEDIKLKAALKDVMIIGNLTNTFITAARLSSSLFEGSRSECDTLINLSLNSIYLIAALLYPFIPETSASICRQLNVPLRKIPTSGELPLKLDDIPGGHILGTPEYLFRHLDDKEIALLRAKFSGASI
ncbi:methionine--tRNA ligase mes1 [Mitosporidium daphniae]